MSGGNKYSSNIYIALEKGRFDDFQVPNIFFSGFSLVKKSMGSCQYSISASFEEEFVYQKMSRLRGEVNTNQSARAKNGGSSCY